MKFFPVCITFKLLIIISTSSYIFSNYSATKTEKYYTFTYGIKIKNNQNSLSNFRIYLPLPSDFFDQKILNLKANIETDKLLESKKHGLKYMYFNKKKLNKNAEILLELEIKLKKGNKIINFSNPKINNELCDEKCLNEHLKNENIINLQHKEIQDFTKNIKNSDTIDKAYFVFNYVNERLKKKNKFEGLIPVDIVLSKGEGECSDFATLFVTIMRALKIPSRHVIGRIFDEDLKKSFHVWAEFYDSRYGWISVDPYFYKWKGKILFGYEPEEYIVFHKGINIPLPLGERKTKIPMLQTYYYFYSSNSPKSNINISYIWKIKK